MAEFQYKQQQHANNNNIHRKKQQDNTFSNTLSRGGKHNSHVYFKAVFEGIKPNKQMLKD